MRKVSSILLIVVLLFQIGGLVTVFSMVKKQHHSEIKKRIKAGVPEGELVVFRFEVEDGEVVDPDFQKHERNEFRFRGKMFDIVRHEDHGDFVVYFCIDDHQESLLFAGLHNILSNELQNDPGSKNCRSLYENLVNTMFFVTSNEWMTINISHSGPFGPVHESLEQNRTEPECPPPDFNLYV